MNTDKPDIKTEAGRAKIPVQRLVMHLLRMLFGWFLYWMVAMAMPAKWWISSKGWFWWSVQFFGYYAYQPNNLKWWQPMENNQ